MPNHVRVARDRNRVVTLTGYYSNTFDVIAGVGEDDDYRMEVIASFTDYKDAQVFVPNNGVWIVGIRPPHLHVTTALNWIHVVNTSQVEGVEIK